MRLRQVLLNLMGNALKYSSAGSGVEISCEADDEIVTVRLRDHGTGIPPGDQDYFKTLASDHPPYSLAQGILYPSHTSRAIAVTVDEHAICGS